MTQTTHTPGPWSLRMTGWQTNPAAIYSPRRPGAVACIPARTSVPLDEQSANARLIAAAPDLLAALESAIEALIETRYYPSEIKRLRNAITKAKGQ